MNKLRFLVLSVFVITLLITACLNPFNDEGGTSLVINLGGNARAATGFNDAVQSGDLSFNIILTNLQTGDIRHAEVNSDASQARVTDLSPGDWNIHVDVSIFGYPYAMGKIESFKIESGQNSVNVPMERLIDAFAVSMRDGAEHDFGTVLQGSLVAPTLTLTVYNYTDTDPAIITANITSGDSARFNASTTPSPLSIAQDGRGTITISADTNTAGNFNAILTISAGVIHIANITLMSNVSVTYTVTYDLNLGSGTPPPSERVLPGTSITIPDGTGITRPNFVFSGWNTATNGSGTNYNAGSAYTVNADITLYARWLPAVASVEINSTTINYATLAEAFTSVQNSQTATITVLADIPSQPLITISGTGKNITLVNDNSPRTITRAANASLFTINDGNRLIVKGTSTTNTLTLQGMNEPATNRDLIYIDIGGILELEDNVLISGNHVNQGSVVNVNYGTFYMRGGTIRDNSGISPMYAGVLVDGGEFNMSGGFIRDNIFNAGGVSVLGNGSTFNMSNGTISNNQDQGVIVWAGGEFTMTGGTITNNTNTNNVYGSLTGGVLVNGRNGYQGVFNLNSPANQSNVSGNTGNDTPTNNNVQAVPEWVGQAPGIIRVNGASSSGW